MTRDLQFRRLTDDQMIVPHQRHPVIHDSKNPQNIIFVGIKNGQHALFSVKPSFNDEKYRSGNHRLFLRAPPKAVQYSLDGTKRTIGGWRYKLKWQKKGE